MEMAKSHLLKCMFVGSFIAMCSHCNKAARDALRSQKMLAFCCTPLNQGQSRKRLQSNSSNLASISESRRMRWFRTCRKTPPKSAVPLPGAHLDKMRTRLRLRLIIPRDHLTCDYAVDPLFRTMIAENVSGGTSKPTVPNVDFPSFGNFSPASKGRKKLSSVRVAGPRCKAAGCTKGAYFGMESGVNAGRPEWCSTHRREGQQNVRDKRCQHPEVKRF